MKNPRWFRQKPMDFREKAELVLPAIGALVVIALVLIAVLAASGK